MLTRPPMSRIGSEPADAVFTALAAAGMPYAVVRHADLAGPVHGPADVARLLSIDLDQIAKTLLVAEDPRRDAEDPGRRRCALVVLAVTDRAALGAVAATLGWAGAVLASPSLLATRLGQPPTGVSPIGSDLPVLVDPSLARNPDVLVGSGTAGVEIGIDVYSLVALCGARWGAVSTRDRSHRSERSIRTRAVTSPEEMHP